MIKARIEALIEREYLERDESNMKVYHYLVDSNPATFTDFRHKHGISGLRIELVGYASDYSLPYNEIFRTSMLHCQPCCRPGD